MQLSRAILALFAGSLLLGCTGSVMSKGSGASDSSDSAGGNGREPGAGGDNGGPASVGASQWRRLSGDQYIKIVKDVLGVEVSRSIFLADTMTGPFATNILPAQDTEVDRYASAAETVAD